MKWIVNIRAALVLAPCPIPDRMLFASGWPVARVFAPGGPHVPSPETTMSNPDLIRAWKDPEYRATLNFVPDHPAGLIELMLEAARSIVVAEPAGAV